MKTDSQKTLPYQKPDFQRSWLLPHQFDFQIYTDGSGWTDRFAGCSVIGTSDKHKKIFAAAAAYYGADTERAEFEGLLAGLQGILDIMNWNNTQSRRLIQAKPPSVYWVTDRENLVGSVTRGPDGSPLFKRKSTPDLWARFEWYEKHFAVSGVWRERNTVAWQKMADGVASECRTLMQNYVGITRLENRIF